MCPEWGTGRCTGPRPRVVCLRAHEQAADGRFIPPAFGFCLSSLDSAVTHCLPPRPLAPPVEGTVAAPAQPGSVSPFHGKEENDAHPSNRRRVKTKRLADAQPDRPGRSRRTAGDPSGAETRVWGRRAGTRESDAALSHLRWPRVPPSWPRAAGASPRDPPSCWAQSPPSAPRAVPGRHTHAATGHAASVFATRAEQLSPAGAPFPGPEPVAGCAPRFRPAHGFRSGRSHADRGVTQHSPLLRGSRRVPASEEPLRATPAFPGCAAYLVLVCDGSPRIQWLKHDRLSPHGNPGVAWRGGQVGVCPQATSRGPAGAGATSTLALLVTGSP